MTEFELVIHGQPRGKGRHRTTKSGHTFTDAKTRLAEGRVHDAWVNTGSPRIDGPIALLITVVLRRPEGHWRRDGSLSAAGERSPFPTKKPDFDNVAKLVGDALNRCAYHDDAFVVLHRLVKRWAAPGEGEHTRVVVRAMPVPGLSVLAAKNTRRAA